MRWLVVSLLLSAALYFSFRGQFIAQPTDVPSEDKVGEVVIPKKDPPETPLSKDETLSKTLEASKDILREKALMRSELAGDPHGTPPAVMKAGLVIGEIAEMEARYPERKDKFIRYYKECFESSDTITVTRVQCLKRYVRSANLDGTQKDSVLARLPDPVQRLYKRSEARE